MQKYRDNQALLASRLKEGQPAGDNYVHCLPDGMPAMMMGMFPMEIFQRPEQINITQEAFNQTRRIYMNQKLPKWDEVDPSFYGASVGHWEGDTLVVRTIGFRDGLWLDTSGSTMSDAAKMTERIRRPNFGTLEIEVTVDDPKTYTRPWTVSMPQTIVLDTELIDEFCLENEKSSQRMNAK